MNTSTARTVYGAWRFVSGQVSALRVLDRFNNEPVAKQRLKILEIADKYGDNVASDAYGITTRTIRNWKKTYRESVFRGCGNVILHDPNSLIPKSRRPHHLRTSMIRPEIVEEIRKLRYAHGCIGKHTIKPLLDKYCTENGYTCISESSIGKIIKKRNMLQPNTKFYHYPSRYKRARKPKERVRHSPKIAYNGYIEVDTIVRYYSKFKVYVYNAIDVRNKIMYSRAYRRKSTRCARDFMKRLFEFYPFEILTIQTDNGSEFEKLFDSYLQEKQIPHKYIPPRTPRVNGFIERANRTLKQEFLYENEYLVDAKGLSVFNDRMQEYLHWYNYERPHTVLGGVSPMEWIKNN